MDDAVLGSMMQSMSESRMMKSVVRYIAPEKTFRDHPFEDRYLESTRIMQKYPDRIPVICEHAQSANPLPHDSKKKFLIPRDMTVGQFLYVIRRRVKLPPEQALFLFVVKQERDNTLSNVLAPTSQIIETVYEQYKDRDHFLYFSVASENTFG